MININTDEDIKAFVAACNRTCAARVLVCEKRISELLQTIAASPKITDIFKSALADYNRQAEFFKSKTKVGGRSKLVPPQNQTKLLAYVFCLLLEIDSGKRPLREFLDEYYYHTNPNEEFALFSSSLIVPFRDVTEYVYYNGAESYLDDDSVDMTLREQAKQFLQELNTAVGESVSVTQETKQELFLIARAIETSLTPNRIDLVKPLLAGYKNTAFSCALREKLMPTIDKLYRLMVSSEIF